MSEKSDVRIDATKLMAMLSRSTQLRDALEVVAKEVAEEAASIARVVAYDEGYYADLFDYDTIQITNLRRQYQRRKVRRRLTYGTHRYIDPVVIDGKIDKYDGSVGAVVNHDRKAIWIEYGSMAKGPRRVMLTAAERIGKRYNIEVEVVYDKFHEANTEELARRISKGRREGA